MNSRLNVELHPLQNVEILSTIFKFCSFEDLKNCRLVGSKVWLNASLNLWREKAVLRIKYYVRSSSSAVSDGVGLHRLKAFYEDQEDPLQLQKKPFKNFKLKDFRSFSFEKGSVLLRLLDRCSSFIKRLTFEDCEFSQLEDFLDIIFLRAPNLVELKLEGSFSVKKYVPRDEPYPMHSNLKCIGVKMYDDGLNPTPMTKILRKLLSNITDLQEVQIREYDLRKGTFDNPVDGTDLMNIIAKIRREDMSKLQIKNLEIGTLPLTEYGFNGVINFETETFLPLERFIGRIVDVMHLKPYSETLKFLNISFEYDTFSYKLANKLVCLPHLKEFHTDGSPSQVFKNLNKLEALELQELVVEDKSSNSNPYDCFFNFRKSINIKELNANFANVVKLECYNASLNYVIDLRDFKHLSRAMPNVKHAKMPLTKTAFTELCKVWQNLLTLTISDRYGRYTRIDDETITGIKPDLDLDRDGLKVESNRLPNITNLKLLTDFEYSGALTGHSVKFGFLHLPRLHRLNVKLKRISDESVSELQKKVNVLEIEVYTSC